MSSFEEVNEIDEPESKESFVEVRPVQSHRTQLHPQEVTESGATDSTPAYLDREDGFIPGSPAIDDDKDVSSSVENIIPPQMVKGFGMFFNWAKQTATATAVLVKEKAKEINESETMRDFKEKTSEVVAQAAEATAPIWTTCAHAAESASEQAVLAAEKMQPTFDSVIWNIFCFAVGVNDTMLFCRCPIPLLKVQATGGSQYLTLLQNGWMLNRMILSPMELWKQLLKEMETLRLPKDQWFCNFLAISLQS